MVSRGSGLVLTGNLGGQGVLEGGPRVLSTAQGQTRWTAGTVPERNHPAGAVRRDLSHEPDAGTEGTISAIHCA